MADLGGVGRSSGALPDVEATTAKETRKSGELGGRKVEIGTGRRILRGIGNALRSFGRGIVSLASRIIEKITAPLSRLRRAEAAGGTGPASLQRQLAPILPAGLELRSQDGRLVGSISGPIRGEAGELVRSFYADSVNGTTLEDGEGEPRFTKEFWVDLDRSTILLGKDREGEDGEIIQAPRLTSEDARESLLAFADDDPKVASNLSRFLFQGLGNAIMAGMSQTVQNAQGDAIILGMASVSDDASSQKVRVTRDESGAFLIDFSLRAKVTGISTAGAGKALELDDGSTAQFSMTVRVTQEELASGRNHFTIVGEPSYSLNLDLDEAAMRQQLRG